MVRLTVSLVASARSAPRLMHALRSLTPPLRQRPGHLGCSTWMDSDHTVHYQEDWATEPDMRERVVSDGFTGSSQSSRRRKDYPRSSSIS
jgi:hypothetical protein